MQKRAGRAPGSMPTTLLDYFPEDFLLFVDESHVTLPQVRAMYGGDYARKKTLVEMCIRDRAHLRGQNGRLVALIDRMLRLTGYFSALAGAAFWVWGQPLAEALYGSAEAGSYLVILGPAMPLMYLCLLYTSRGQPAGTRARWHCAFPGPRRHASDIHSSA